MEEKGLRKSLSNLSLGEIRFFQQTGSTNDLALAWATTGAEEFSLVIADEQTSGRGRQGRRWLTPPGTALAFSIILRLVKNEKDKITLFSGLGALALYQVLSERGLPAQIKWPNDVLISGRKVAGVLVESVWMGDQVESVIVGMGVNVLPESVPPASEVLFPPTSVHSEGLKIDRLDLLHNVLEKLILLRHSMGGEEFIQSWEKALAYMGEPVHVWTGPGPSHDKSFSVTGILRGLESNGALRLDTTAGLQILQFGEIHLRPV